MGGLVDRLYTGDHADVLWVEAVADRVERALIQQSEQGR